MRNDATSLSDRADDSPAESAKRAQIIDGARRVFLSRGFAAASMGEIARAAKVSKGTLYVYFDNKEALFRALIAEQRRLAAERLTALEAGESDVETALARFAESLITALTEPDHIALVRMVVGVVEEFPDLGRALYNSGPAFGAAHLATYFEARQAEGLLAMDDPKLAAWHFLGMCKEPAMSAVSLAASPQPDAETIEGYARAAARAFMRAHGAPPR